MKKVRLAVACMQHILPHPLLWPPSRLSLIARVVEPVIVSQVLHVLHGPCASPWPPLRLYIMWCDCARACDGRPGGSSSMLAWV